MAKKKKTCPECDSELLEDGNCPTCGPLDEKTEDIKEEGKDDDSEIEE